MNLIMDILPMEFRFIACNVKLDIWIWNLSASESEAEILCIHLEFKSLAQRLPGADCREKLCESILENSYIQCAKKGKASSKSM